MPFIFKRLALLTSIAMVLVPDKALLGSKDEPKFTPGAAASHRSHQTSEKVTIGVLPYFNDEDTRPVFGKHNPYTYGVLPVLVVIQNESAKTIKVQSLEGLGAGRHPERKRHDHQGAISRRSWCWSSSRTKAPRPSRCNLSKRCGWGQTATGWRLRPPRMFAI